jgi:hypothetical protein
MPNSRGTGLPIQRSSMWTTSKIVVTGSILPLNYPIPSPSATSAIKARATGTAPIGDRVRAALRVQLVVLTLLKRLEALEARLKQNSSNSSRPPSTDTPSTKRQRRMPAAERRKPGGKPGHPGHPQVWLDPTATVALFPEGCSCGHRE